MAEAINNIVFDIPGRKNTFNRINDDDKNNNFFDEILVETAYYNVDDVKDVFNSASSNFSLLHLNIRSINKNFENLKLMLNNIKNKFSIICLTETWCHRDTINSNFQLSGYKSIHQPRENGIGGGVSIFVQNSLTFKHVDNLKVNDADCESFTIEIINKAIKNTFITALYRPPNGDYNQFENHINYLLPKLIKKHVYLLGDFNLNFLNNKTDNHVARFINTLLQYSVFPIINKPTRVTKTTASIIDNIITNNFTRAKMQSGIIKTDITDHFPVFLITDSATPNKKIETKTIYVRNINNESIITFRDLLQEINWELLTDCNDVNNGYDFFIRVFTKQYEKAFPKLKKQSKKNYYSLLLNKTFGNARKTWNVIKEITGVGNVKIDNFPKRLQRDGNIGDAFANKEIAETFNDFFINIGKKVASAIPEGSKSFEPFLKKSDSIMDESELLVDELRLAISMLKTNKSVGLDEINPDVVKAASDIIEKPLFIIFNLSLRNGIFPDQLKLA
ncbi:uncharacterized protein LOC136095198 [Hydra vulgaris]|uniref:uncharacterized protein LOC136095198 n=1 Tax=Hydra vulgaris TaxID=6087 RepID=UPI0032EA6A18